MNPFRARPRARSRGFSLRERVARIVRSQPLRDLLTLSGHISPCACFVFVHDSRLLGRQQIEGGWNMLSLSPRGTIRATTPATLIMAGLLVAVFATCPARAGFTTFSVGGDV